MVLGALPAINTSVIKDRILTAAADPAKVQTFAANTAQTYNANAGASPLVQPPSENGGTDYMSMLKKYAPYIIGAVVLYYVISKK